MIGGQHHHRTNESYLGHDMKDAIDCHNQGEWPRGMEILEDILGRQGNMITTEDMKKLSEYDSSLFQKVRGKCYAVVTCRPDPEREHGGCSRESRPGCQTYVSPSQQFYENSFIDVEPYFRRGHGKHGTCEDCPIKTKAGMCRPCHLKTTNI